MGNLDNAISDFEKWGNNRRDMSFPEGYTQTEIIANVLAKVKETNVKIDSINDLAGLAGQPFGIATLDADGKVVQTANTTENTTEAVHAETADNATHATTADSATTAGHATTADSATSATNASSAVYAENCNIAQSATISNIAISANNAEHADDATHADTADSATSATTAGHATTADSATSATTAGHATTADSATSATTADKATNYIDGENNYPIAGKFAEKQDVATAFDGDYNNLINKPLGTSINAYGSFKVDESIIPSVSLNLSLRYAYFPLYGLVTGGLESFIVPCRLKEFTFVLGRVVCDGVLSVADNGVGMCRITTNEEHLLATGEKIVILNPAYMTSSDSPVMFPNITVISSTVFDIDYEYYVDDLPLNLKIRIPTHLKANVSGVYNVGTSLSGLATTAKTFLSSMFVNGERKVETTVRDCSDGGVVDLVSSGNIDILENDIVWIGLQNNTDTAGLTIKNISLYANKIDDIV